MRAFMTSWAETLLRSFSLPHSPFPVSFVYFRGQRMPSYVWHPPAALLWTVREHGPLKITRLEHAKIVTKGLRDPWRAGSKPSSYPMAYNWLFQGRRTRREGSLLPLSVSIHKLKANPACPMPWLLRRVWLPNTPNIPFFQQNLLLPIILSSQPQATGKSARTGSPISDPVPSRDPFMEPSWLETSSLFGLRSNNERASEETNQRRQPTKECSHWEWAKKKEEKEGSLDLGINFSFRLLRSWQKLNQVCLPNAETQPETGTREKLVWLFRQKMSWSHCQSSLALSLSPKRLTSRNPRDW